MANNPHMVSVVLKTACHSSQLIWSPYNTPCGHIQETPKTLWTPGLHGTLDPYRHAPSLDKGPQNLQDSAAPLPMLGGAVDHVGTSLPVIPYNAKFWHSKSNSVNGGTSCQKGL